MAGLADRWRDLSTFLRKEGLGSVLSRLRERYLQVHEYQLYVWDLEDDYDGLGIEPDWEWFGPEQRSLDEVRAAHPDLPREFSLDLTHGGQLYYMIFCDGRPAAIIWLFRRGEYSRFFDLQEGTVEVNYAATLPEFRGQRMFARLVNCAAAEMRKQGYQRLCTCLGTTNVNVLRSAEHTGFRKLQLSHSWFSFVKRVKL